MATMVNVQDSPKMIDRSVSVSAAGSVATEPDQAVIATGVTTDANTAREAMSLNSAAMQRLIDGLRSAGINAKDIQTTAVQINPRYTQGQNGRAPMINGYSAFNQVRIVVRDLPMLGDILDQALTLGANHLGGIAFEVSKAEVLKDEARKLAVANAYRRATLYASAAGVSIGQVLSILETAHGPQPHQFAGAQAGKPESIALKPGSVDLTVEVHMTWALK
jgi:uncharacterized protein